ncbi:hypothetical protein [Pseudomonas mediterranea]|uniref:hypothetical protein n=1 Tax=Pseudomonas mediterranea TaxID=183795 RepID=UPI0006D8C47F|nr:hypothetical protein [Pseudomonas mediterranea]
MHTSKKAAAKNIANRFSVTEWRDNVETAAKDMVTASKRVLDLVLAARDHLIEEETVRDALQHAFGEAYADLHGCTFAEALTAKSVKNRVSDAMAVFKAEQLPTALPSNLQHAAAECRKLNRKAKPAANEEGNGDAEEGPGLEGDVQQVDAVAQALRMLQASLNVLKATAKGATLTSLLEDMADLVQEIGNELDASEE